MAILNEYVKLAEDILKAPTPRRAHQIASVMPKDRDLQVNVLWDVINIKADQYPKFKAELLNTGNKTLIENTNDPFWGRGKDGNGRNMFGNMLQDLRNTQRQEMATGRIPSIDRKSTPKQVTNLGFMICSSNTVE